MSAFDFVWAGKRTDGWNGRQIRRKQTQQERKKNRNKDIDSNTVCVELTESSSNYIDAILWSRTDLLTHVNHHYTIADISQEGDNLPYTIADINQEVSALYPVTRICGKEHFSTFNACITILTRYCLCFKTSPRGLPFTWWGCYVWLIATEFAHSFFVSMSVLMVLSTVFHSINSPDNSSFSHFVLLVLYLPYWSFQPYVSLW